MVTREGVTTVRVTVAGLFCVAVALVVTLEFEPVGTCLVIVVGCLFALVVVLAVELTVFRAPFATVGCFTVGVEFVVAVEEFADGDENVLSAFDLLSLILLITLLLLLIAGADVLDVELEVVAKLA